VSSSRRNIFRLGGDFLWARRLRLVGALGSLHNLHVRPDGQMIGKGIACWVGAMRGMIDRSACDRCKSSLDGPGICIGFADVLVGADQLAAEKRRQHCPQRVQGRGTYGGETDVAGVNAVLAPAGD
jgi:hypothetical protein